MMSAKLTLVAATRMSACPGPGVGSGRSSTRSTSGSPAALTTTARMVAPPAAPRLRGCRTAARRAPRVRALLLDARGERLDGLGLGGPPGFGEVDRRAY